MRKNVAWKLTCCGKSKVKKEALFEHFVGRTAVDAEIIFDFAEMTKNQRIRVTNKTICRLLKTSAAWSGGSLGECAHWAGFSRFLESVFLRKKNPRLAI